MQIDYNQAAQDSKSIPEAIVQEAANIADTLRPDPLKQEVDVGKLRGIEFRELLQERRKIMSEREQIDMGSIENFDDQVCSPSLMQHRGRPPS